jgi:hypothetical protein
VLVERSRSAGGPGRRGRPWLPCQRARDSRWFRGWRASTVRQAEQSCSGGAACVASRAGPCERGVAEDGRRLE